MNGKNSNQEKLPAMVAASKARMNAKLPITGDNSPIASSLLGLMLILGSVYHFKK
ncbi:LPXTG cell wall anchor domain-containing protein [Listeria valentina]|uniref:LPXTG cell wall anchor domain-containing protein n=1 Tax=Listeria valentina TaxID=2705293 RepID=UPI001430B906|nr:LPXTG cell wall anchor domain-containing protein [Listeria valentina]